jgi:uncharacterized membrane protein
METVGTVEELRQAAAGHRPFFMTSPGETDWLLISMMVFLILAVVGIGVFYFKLHALPEHMAHKGQRIQYEIVAVLALLALFTHNHAFWIIGLLLALVPIPDFVTPISSMAQSLVRMADNADSTAKPRQPLVATAAPVEDSPPPIVPRED